MDFPAMIDVPGGNDDGSDSGKGIGVNMSNFGTVAETATVLVNAQKLRIADDKGKGKVVEDVHMLDGCEEDVHMLGGCEEDMIVRTRRRSRSSSTDSFPLIETGRTDVFDSTGCRVVEGVHVGGSSAAHAQYGEARPNSYLTSDEAGPSRSNKLQDAIETSPEKTSHQEIVDKGKGKAEEYVSFFGDEDKHDMETSPSQEREKSEEERLQESLEDLRVRTFWRMEDRRENVQTRHQLRAQQRASDFARPGKGLYNPDVYWKKRLEGLRSEVSANSASNHHEWVPSRQPNFRKKRVAPSLKDLSLAKLSTNFGFVESLVGVPDTITNQISAQLCAKRLMTPDSFLLYMASEPVAISVPDCSSISEAVFTKAFANWSPLKVIDALDLGHCGRGFSDKVCSSIIKRIAPSSLQTLDSIILAGAYLLTVTALADFLKAMIDKDNPKLRTLKLTHCSLISVALLTSCGTLLTNLKEFSLDSCTPPHEAHLVGHSFANMPQLESLSLSGYSVVTDEIIVEIIARLSEIKTGCGLRELSIADCSDLTDNAINKISILCPTLEVLDLSNVPLLSDAAIESLTESGMKLRTLRLTRGNYSDETLAVFVCASGECLTELSLNSVRKTGNLTVGALAERSRKTLELLDLSFCRKVNDYALGFLADNCTSLRELRLFGCTRITDLFLNGHSNSDLTVIGVPNTAI